MFTLYHHPLCAKSRMVRIILAEKKLDFKLVEEKFWQRRPEFLELNPASETPVLVDEKGHAFADINAIIEHLEENFDARNLLGRQPLLRAETRRLIGWFSQKFHAEVTKNLVDEKYFKSQVGATPNSKAMSAGRQNIFYHLDYIDFLIRNHSWVNGDEMTLADISAAAEISVLDFFGDVPWDHSSRVKHWYSVIKSRPSFRQILEDKLPGLNPPAHYGDCDF